MRARGKAEVIIAKQRHGRTGAVELGFQGEFTRFFDLTESDRFSINTTQSTRGFG